MKKDEAIRNTKNFDELLDVQYGKIGSKERDAFEARAQILIKELEKGEKTEPIKNFNAHEN